MDEENIYEKFRILILEDDPQVRLIVRRVVREIGFRTIYEGENGIDGFKELLRIRPDVILCDIHMKPMGGLTFLKKLRNLGFKPFSGIPVIFLTADRNSETVSEAADLGPNGYLAKPISQALLKERLDAVLFPGES